MTILWFIQRISQSAFGGIRGLPTRLNRWLIGLAKLLGTEAGCPGDRYARFFGSFAVLLVLACLPVRWLPLLALLLAYLGIMSVSWAWSVNEACRTRIARKLVPGNADALPDLRLLALVSAVLLPLLFPLIFQQAQAHFQLYRVPPGTNYWTWLAFTFDSCCKAFVNWMDIYGVRFTAIEPAARWGQHLVLLKRLSFDLILIQGVWRILEIRARIREGAAVVRYDAELAARLGKRVVPVLIRALHHPSPQVRKQAALALGEIKDRRAIEPLGRALWDECAAVREAAAQALGGLGDVRAVDLLVQILHKDDSDKIVLFHDRQSAAQALASLGDPRALAPLEEALQDQRPAVRAAATKALAVIRGEPANGPGSRTGVAGG
jgi:hypothetical protein